jgi:hypothetical protein
MTMNFHKKLQQDFVFHFFLNFYYSLFILFFCSLFFFQHADVHATACWRIESYAPGHYMLFSYQTGYIICIAIISYSLLIEYYKLAVLNIPYSIIIKQRIIKISPKILQMQLICICVTPFRISNTIKPAHVVTSIKRSLFVLSEHFI